MISLLDLNRLFSKRRYKSCAAFITQTYSNVPCFRQLVSDTSVCGWWQPSVFTYHWNYERYRSARHCIWRAVVPKSRRLDTAQVLWSDTRSIQRRCFIREKDVYRDLVCRGDAVQQSQWKLEAARCLWKLTRVFMYITLSTEDFMHTDGMNQSQ